MHNRQHSVTETRVRELIDAYGSNPAAWPAEERAAALLILASSADLQAQQARASELDDMIRHDRDAALQDTAATQALHARILAGLPERSQRPVPAHGLWQNLFTSLFSPRLGFALATFMVVAVSLYLQIPADTQLASPNKEFEQWAWYDITGQTLGNQGEVATLSMMDLIELEINEDGG